MRVAYRQIDPRHQHVFMAETVVAQFRVDTRRHVEGLVMCIAIEIYRAIPLDERGETSKDRHMRIGPGLGQCPRIRYVVMLASCLGGAVVHILLKTVVQSDLFQPEGSQIVPACQRVTERGLIVADTGIGRGDTEVVGI